MMIRIYDNLFNHEYIESINVYKGDLYVTLASGAPESYYKYKVNTMTMNPIDLIQDFLENDQQICDITECLINHGD